MLFNFHFYMVTFIALSEEILSEIINMSDTDGMVHCIAYVEYELIYCIVQMFDGAKF